MLIKRAAQNALQKLAISKPDTKPATTYRRKPFITRVKNPRVKMFMGKVKIIKIGLKMALRIPKIKEANTSAFKFSIWIIPNMLATMKIETAVMSHFNKKAFISYAFNCLIYGESFIPHECRSPMRDNPVNPLGLPFPRQIG
jgi:hypothetical protein